MNRNDNYFKNLHKNYHKVITKNMFKKLKHMLKPRMVLHTHNPQHFRHRGRRLIKTGRACLGPDTGPCWLLWGAPADTRTPSLSTQHRGQRQKPIPLDSSVSTSHAAREPGLKKNTTKCSQTCPDSDEQLKFTKVEINKEEEKNHSFNYSGAPSCGGETTNQNLFENNENKRIKDRFFFF